MNRERFAGICQQIAAKMNETWGEFMGDPARAAAGRRAQIHAKALQRNGIAKEQSACQLRDFLRRNRNWQI